MAECATIPSCAKLQLQRNYVRLSHSIPGNTSFKTVKRKEVEWRIVCFCGCRKISYGNHRIPLEVCSSGAPTASTSGGNVVKESSFRCFCYGALLNPDGSTLSNWVPFIDQVLLMVSVVLAHMAGVVPSKSSSFSTGRNMLDHDALPANFISSGRYGGVKVDHQAGPEYAWGEVKGKLLDALDALQPEGNLDSRTVEYEKYCTKRPLSLYAVKESPRLRLLLASVQQFEKEVKNIAESYQNAARDAWLTVLTDIIQNSSLPLCVTWLEGELHLQDKKLDNEILSAMLKKSKTHDAIIQNIKKSGKEDLYVDLLYFLRFGSFSTSGHYDNKLLSSHGVDILEDLVITLADGIASNYLELISVDSNISSEMNRLGLILCSLSSRALQRLRNEVALKGWLYQNMESVISMYEDYFDLNTFHIQLVEEPTASQSRKLHWWRKFIFKKSTSTSSPLCYLVIRQISVFVKRTKELRALSGWRYYFSLFLEFSDVAMPMVRAIFAKLSNAVSFFLVCLIGRSLGLIYTGIKQSLGWRAYMGKID